MGGVSGCEVGGAGASVLRSEVGEVFGCEVGKVVGSDVTSEVGPDAISEKCACCDLVTL